MIKIIHISFFIFLTFSANANDIKDLIGKRITLNWDNSSCTYNLHSWYQISGDCTNEVHKIKNIVNDDGFSYIQWDNVKRFNGEGSFNEVLFYNNDGGITYASLDNIDGAEWIYSSPKFSIQEINYKKESKEINLINKRLDFHMQNIKILPKYMSNLYSETEINEVLNCDTNFLYTMAIDSENEMNILNDTKNKKLLSKVEKFYKLISKKENSEFIETIFASIFTEEEINEIPNSFKKFSIEEISEYVGLMMAYGFGCSGMFSE